MSPVNGIRPSPLKISKNSHLIHKSSSSSSSHNVKQEQQQQRQPVIIYTHSPQIIHAHPKDFMALVQKLTGSTSESDDQTNKTERGAPASRDRDDDGKFAGKINYKEGEVGGRGGGSMMKPNLAEIPLFTPNSNNLFFSPKGLLMRNPGNDQSMVSSSPAGINADSLSLSPSFMEFLNMRELPDY